jgi:P-type Ca2+ transporter type 2C
MSAHSLSEQPAAWHSLEVDKSLELLKTNAETGLSPQEVQQRLEQYGANELKETGGRSAWQILIDQFTNIMLLMLIAVAIISGVLDLIAWQQGTLKPGELPFKDTIAILAIVILNGILGYVQESRAEKALAALKKLASPNVRVIRDGRPVEVPAQDLVPGDVMLVEAGVHVAADGRLIEESNLQIRESALTGEAEAVNKQAKLILPEETALGDRVNLVFQGTEIVQGRGKILVTNTGMQTELGKIAAMLQAVESEPTPLQQRMTQLGNVLVTGSLVLVAIVIGIGLLRGGNLQELLEVSLSMAVAVVPESLPAVITVTLALGTQRMVRRNALIRKLPAVETLGSVTTICSDKTGTLTQNKMVVQSVYTNVSDPNLNSNRDLISEDGNYSPQSLQNTNNQFLSVTGSGYDPVGEFQLQGQKTEPQEYPALQTLLVACASCNDSFLQQNQGQWKILGDPTEGALVTLAAKGGIEKDQWESKLPRVAEFPFSSERKRMSVICKVEQVDTGVSPIAGIDPIVERLLQASERYLMFTKGSPELILARCTHIYMGSSATPINDGQRSQILAENDTMASKGLRVLGFAYKPLTEIPPEGSDEESEKELVWLGLVGMLDAPRPEVRDAVQECRDAGIRPVMITGDHQLTARAIATDLGIAQEGARALTGQELQRMSDKELEENVDLVSIYARVAPEHKLRIVQALQRRGRFVAMTGDGVNDAPALKQADIGIAMGITGTDVSKEASDMVLLDDNFATIVAATKEGRVVYTNIRRFIKYILGSNIGEVITIAAAPIMGLGGVPLSPLQILWMNLVTDGLPALALAVEPAEPDVMKRPPFSPRESIFARGLGSYMIRIGIVFAIISIILMAWAYNHVKVVTGPDLDPERWKTMVFTALCIAQMGHALAIRSNSQLTIEMNPFSNPYVLAAIVVTSILQLLLVYVPPLRAFFGTHYLSLPELGICLGFSALMFVWIEAEKLFFRLTGRKIV